MNLLNWLFACRHDHATVPRMGWQKCMSCGARRRYRNFGGEPGCWRKDVKILAYPEPQKVRGWWKRMKEARA